MCKSKLYFILYNYVTLYIAKLTKFILSNKTTTKNTFKNVNMLNVFLEQNKKAITKFLKLWALTVIKKTAALQRCHSKTIQDIVTVDRKK